MGILNKFSKNIIDKLDNKVNELNKTIDKAQQNLNDLDSANLNDSFVNSLSRNNENNNNIIDEAPSCFVCGSEELIGGKKTKYGKICLDCLEKLEEFDIEKKDIKYYTCEQIQALCSNTLNAIEIANTFIINNPNIALEEGENCYYIGDACGAKVKTLTTGYTGKRRGFSFAITNGMSYHTGESAGQAVREHVLDTSLVGKFALTNHRFILMTSQYGFEIKTNKAVSVEIRQDGLAFYDKNKMHLVITDDIEKITVILKVLTAATEECENNKLLQTKEKAEKAPKNKSNKENKLNTSFSGADEIRKYKQLMDEGIITEEQFEKKKLDILGM